MATNKISLKYTREIDKVICLWQKELGNLGQGGEKDFSLQIVQFFHVLFNQNINK